ncbi:MAG: hypothetical protein AAF526_01780 [Pseudomonadota bacterium]
MGLKVLSAISIGGISAAIGALVGVLAAYELGSPPPDPRSIKVTGELSRQGVLTVNVDNDAYDMRADLAVQFWRRKGGELTRHTETVFVPFDVHEIGADSTKYTVPGIREWLCLGLPDCPEIQDISGLFLIVRFGSSDPRTVELQAPAG